MNLLFVCTANICRSPSAEALARSAGPADVHFSSAGTHARDGEPINPDMVRILPADLDTSGFRSRRLTAAMLEEADLVLTMEVAHRTFILDDHPALFRKVFTLGQVAKVLEQAPEGLGRGSVLAHLGDTRRNADPALDVPDPYRRGVEAATVCIDRLQDLLHALLPPLAR